MTLTQFDAAAAAGAVLRRPDGYNGHMVDVLGHVADRPLLSHWCASSDGRFRWIVVVRDGCALPVHDADLEILRRAACERCGAPTADHTADGCEDVIGAAYAALETAANHAAQMDDNAAAEAAGERRPWLSGVDDIRVIAE